MEKQTIITFHKQIRERIMKDVKRMSNSNNYQLHLCSKKKKKFRNSFSVFAIQLYRHTESKDFKTICQGDSEQGRTLQETLCII